MVVPGGEAHPGDEPQHEDDEAHDHQRGRGVAQPGGRLLALQRGHRGHRHQVLVTLLQQEVLVLHHLERHHQVLLLLLHLRHHRRHLRQPLLLLQDLGPGDLDVFALEGLPVVLEAVLQQPGRVLLELHGGELRGSHVVEGVDEDGGEVGGVALEPRQQLVDLPGPGLLVVARTVPDVHPPDRKR